MARNDARNTSRHRDGTTRERRGPLSASGRSAESARGGAPLAGAATTDGADERAGAAKANETRPAQSQRGAVAARAGTSAAVGPWPGELWTPQIEVFQRGDDFVVRADLPGMRRADVTVEVADDALAIRGERRKEHEERGAGYYRSERAYGSFHRRIGLPEGVDPESIKARFADGVLEVTMRATGPGREGRRIAVEGAPAR